MTDFKVVHTKSADKVIPKFEAEVKELLDQGWRVINCGIDSLRLFAFLTKES